ncbi:MAG: putative DNA-binding domain-containing protein [Rhodospirillales bacterium]|nr:putative DNA-binding domain-containing protein [Rhodospirillales bacterium]
MTALRDYQSAFAAAIAAGDASRALRLFQGSSLRRQRGFRVYANNRMHALVSALGATFPAVQRSLGEKAFASVAIGFARRHPPARNALLLWYGASFPAFLESLEGMIAPHLADLARLEWAWLEAYHAAEAEPLAAAQVAALTPEQVVAARLTLHPSARLLRSRWAVDRLWRGDPDLTVAGDGGVKEAEGARCLVVLRPEAMVLVFAVSPPVFAALAAFRDGAAFAEATLHLDGAGYLAELQAMIAAGLFTAIETRL